MLPATCLQTVQGALFLTVDSIKGMNEYLIHLKTNKKPKKTQKKIKKGVDKRGGMRYNMKAVARAAARSLKIEQRR